MLQAQGIASRKRRKCVNFIALTAPLAAAALASCSCRCTAAKSACSCLQRACSELRLLQWWDHTLAVLLIGFLPYRRKSPSLACKPGCAQACRGRQVAAGYSVVFQGCHAMLTLQQHQHAALPFRRSPAPPAASRPPGWSWRPPSSAAPAPHNMLISGLRKVQQSQWSRHAAGIAILGLLCSADRRPAALLYGLHCPCSCSNLAAQAIRQRRPRLTAKLLCCFQQSISDRSSAPAGGALRWPASLPAAAACCQALQSPQRAAPLLLRPFHAPPPADWSRTRPGAHENPLSSEQSG